MRLFLRRRYYLLAQTFRCRFPPHCLTTLPSVHVVIQHQGSRQGSRMPEWETRLAWEGIFPVQEEGQLLLSLLRIVWPELLGAELVFSY